MSAFCTARVHARSGAAAALARPPRSTRSVSCAAQPKLDFNTVAFQKDLVEFAGAPEYIVKGGRDKFAGLPKAFEGIKEVLSSFDIQNSVKISALSFVSDFVWGMSSYLAQRCPLRVQKRRLGPPRACLGHAICGTEFMKCWLSWCSIVASTQRLVMCALLLLSRGAARFCAASTLSSLPPPPA
jgi:hypothetical protein